MLYPLLKSPFLNFIKHVPSIYAKIHKTAKSASIRMIMKSLTIKSMSRKMKR